MRSALLILALCLIAGGAVVAFNWNRVGRPEPAPPITCTNCHEVIVICERSGMLVHAETRSVTCAPYIERMHNGWLADMRERNRAQFEQDFRAWRTAERINWARAHGGRTPPDWWKVSGS